MYGFVTCLGLSILFGLLVSSLPLLGFKFVPLSAFQLLLSISQVAQLTEHHEHAGNLVLPEPQPLCGAVHSLQPADGHKVSGAKLLRHHKLLGYRVALVLPH